MFHLPGHGGGRRPLVDPAPSGSLLWHSAVRRISILSWRCAEHSQRTAEEVRRSRYDDARAASRAWRSPRICIDQKRARFFSDLSGSEEEGGLLAWRARRA